MEKSIDIKLKDGDRILVKVNFIANTIRIYVHSSSKEYVYKEVENGVNGWSAVNHHGIWVYFLDEICDSLDKLYQEWLFEVEMEKVLSSTEV